MLHWYHCMSCARGGRNTNTRKWCLVPFSALTKYLSLQSSKVAPVASVSAFCCAPRILSLETLQANNLQCLKAWLVDAVLVPKPHCVVSKMYIDLISISLLYWSDGEFQDLRSKETAAISREQFYQIIMEWIQKDLYIVLANRAVLALLLSPLLAIQTKNAGRQIPRIGSTVDKVPTPLIASVYSVGIVLLQDMKVT